MKKMILTTENLYKTYGNQNAVEGLSLAVPENTVYGLLGPNGAGKSTTLKMIAGIAKPTKGAVYYKGDPWKRKDLQEIGALIESPPLYGNLTAYENLLVRTTALGLPKSNISRVLQTVDLTDTGKKKAKKIFYGYEAKAWYCPCPLGQPKTAYTG